MGKGGGGVKKKFRQFRYEYITVRKYNLHTIAINCLIALYKYELKQFGHFWTVIDTM